MQTCWLSCVNVKQMQKEVIAYMASIAINHSQIIDLWVFGGGRQPPQLMAVLALYNFPHDRTQAIAACWALGFFLDAHLLYSPMIHESTFLQLRF